MDTCEDQLNDFLDGWRNDREVGPGYYTTELVGREEATDDDSTDSHVSWGHLYTIYLYEWCEPTDPDCEGTFSDGTDYYKYYESYCHLTESEVIKLINDLS